jgi:two-component system cell cycle sensor histidine kinase/response regulator CckA
VAPSQVAAARVAWLRLIEDGEQRGVLWLRRPDGAIRDVEYSAKANALPGRHLSILRDVTERRQLESQLRQSQKIEAIGRLAGGVAHEFNNLLAVILGYTETLLQELADEELREDAEEIRMAAERAAGLTRQLLAFSRRQAVAPAIVDLNALLADMDTMLRKLIGDERDLLIVSDSPSGRVRADPGQLQQMILNLAMNACDAMPHGGRLTIETANVTLDEEVARRTPGIAPGAYAKLSVSDTGSGITPHAQAHLFEPFFTTKPVGRGAGLGLGAVYGIVRQHRGVITAESKPGQGSTFTVYLPQASEKPGRPNPGPAGLPRGSETILLVDDNPRLRERLLMPLTALGYTVLEAASSEEALFIAECHQAPIHLLLAAVLLPEMSGLELARRLMTIRSELRVLYVAPDGADDLASPEDPVPAAPVVSAAVPPESLAQAIRGILDAPTPGIPTLPTAARPRRLA